MQTASTGIPIGLRILALFLRLVFMAALVAIAVRVSLPQSETLWDITPDFLEVGEAGCIF